MTMALVVLGLMSCSSKNDPEPQGTSQNTPAPKFSISVKNTTEGFTTVSITPSDTTIYYDFRILYPQELASGWNEDSVAKEWKMYADIIDFPYWLNKGNVVDTVDNLFSETEYAVYALQMDSAYNPVGSWTLKKFTTGKLVITDTVYISGEGGLGDYSAEYGWFYVDYSSNDYTIWLSASSEELNGTFYEKGSYTGFVSDGHGLWDIDSFIATGELNEAGTEYSFKGEANAVNHVKYIFDLVCPNP